MWFGKNELRLYLNRAKISSIGGGPRPPLNTPMLINDDSWKWLTFGPLCMQACIKQPCYSQLFASTGTFSYIFAPSISRPDQTKPNPTRPTDGPDSYPALCALSSFGITWSKLSGSVTLQPKSRTDGATACIVYEFIWMCRICDYITHSHDSARVF